MSRESLLFLLQNYAAADPHEKQMAADTIAFIRNYEDCFERSLLCGHVTASGWVVNPEMTHTLLIHHVKLDKWLQPGGHCDGDSDVLQVAQKEVFEETGLETEPPNEAIFDVDVHEIPERKDVPAHLHYDIRFLLTAKKHSETLPANRETKETRWILLGDVRNFNSEDSVMRMVEKTISAR